MEDTESVVEVKIDERYLKRIAKEAHEFCEWVIDNARKIVDKDLDIFERYMALNRINAMMEGSSSALKIAKNGFVTGHNLNHPMLQTEKAKECDWDEHKLEHDDFFTTDEQEKKSEFMGMIGGAIFGALKSAVEDSNGDTPDAPPSQH